MSALPERQPIVAAVPEVDENGNPRVVTRGAVLRRVKGDLFAYQRATTMPRLRILAVVDETVGLRLHAFKANPYCCRCDARLVSVDAGAVVTTADGLRLACRETCFAEAVLEHQPDRAIVAALGRISTTHHLHP
jgi:hypothetical protein